ncbi:uncharacterized protein LOC132270341 [Cornus florida]|uniref:uncharacterized protein LOC132270341 n=1 Tax=Cornus florida TaxID=4283 RepID=UPI00289B4099|nr:uncharacterized protein LOC132270341 [Cornus florida]
MCGLEWWIFRVWCGLGGEEVMVVGTSSFILVGKLRILKDKIKIWNKEVGNLEWRKNKALVDIAEFDRLDAVGGFEESQRSRRIACQAECAEIAVMEQISWRQKSRALWLKEGDQVLYRASSLKAKTYGLHFDSISVEDRDRLERAFTEEEVLTALKSCNGDKAPSLDGFTMSFLLESWEVVRQEIMGTFHEFHSTGKFEKSPNASFIALIPKKGGASDIKDFRPISLIRCLYKLIAKVLASRLRGVLDGVISESLNAFIRGRQILDSALIASECVDFRLRSGFPGVLYKLDIEKAYNHVCWNFLFYLLERMGFSERWRKWIVTCISSVRFSILVHGSPSRLMRRAFTLGLFRGFKIGPEVVSGLRINMGKNVLVPMGEVQEVDSLAAVLGCRTGSFPISYLGLLLGVSSRRVGCWDPVIERFERRLAGWKKQCLLNGGKVTLVKSVLSSLPTYFLSLF